MVSVRGTQKPDLIEACLVGTPIGGKGLVGPSAHPQRCPEHSPPPPSVHEQELDPEVPTPPLERTRTLCGRVKQTHDALLSSVAVVFVSVETSRQPPSRWVGQARMVIEQGHFAWTKVQDIPKK